jgi:hydroxymethylbilane synthase
LRGNLDTRLGKLDRGEFDAIILAAAGLKRLGMAQRIRALLTPDEIVPAAGQGVLGIEALEGRHDLNAVLAPLLHAPSFLESSAEREVSRQLGGSCRVPLAAFATTSGSKISLTACVGSLGDNGLAEMVSAEQSIDISGQDAVQALNSVVGMAQKAVVQLKALGAEALLSRHLS